MARPPKGGFRGATDMAAMSAMSVTPRESSGERAAAQITPSFFLELQSFAHVAVAEVTTL